MRLNIIKSLLKLSKKILPNFKKNIQKNITASTGKHTTAKKAAIGGSIFTATAVTSAGVNEYIDEKNWLGDSFTKNSTDEKRKLRNRYKQVAACCSRIGITYEQAKRLKILERIAGVDTEEELNNLSDEEFNEVVSAMEEAYGWRLNTAKKTKHLIKSIPILGKIMGKYVFREKSNELSDETVETLISSAKRRKILAKNDISVRQQWKYDKFSKNIATKINKIMPEESDDVNAYAQAAFKLHEEEITRIQNCKNAGEKEKLYNKFKQKVILEMTSDGIDTEKSGKVMSALVGYMKSDERAETIEDFIELGTDTKNVNLRAYCAQSVTDFTLTNTDAWGNTPSQSVALNYQKVTFSNMDDTGIEKSLSALDTRTGEIESRYRELLELKNKGQLTPELEAELNLMTLKHNNLNITGHSGAILGIAENNYVPESSRNEYMNSVSSSMSRHGITEEVINAANSYIQSHPEEYPAGSEKLNKITNYLNTIVEKNNSEKSAKKISKEEDNSGELNKPVIKSEIKSTDMSDTDLSENSINNDKTKDKTKFKNTKIDEKSDTKASDKAKTYTTSPISKNNATQKTVAASGKSKVPGVMSLNAKVAITKAMNNGNSYDEILNIAQENGVSKTSALVEILNNCNNKNIVDCAVNAFLKLQPAEQKISFRWINGGYAIGKIARKMDLTILEEAMNENKNSFNYYAKEDIENIIEKRYEQLRKTA